MGYQPPPPPPNSKPPVPPAAEDAPDDMYGDDDVVLPDDVIQRIYDDATRALLQKYATEGRQPTAREIEAAVNRMARDLKEAEENFTASDYYTQVDRVFSRPASEKTAQEKEQTKINKNGALLDEIHEKLDTLLAAQNIPIPPAAPPEAVLDDAQQKLADIVRQGDVDNARAFFRDRFWRDAACPPVAAHLQIALDAGNAAMCKLLVTHGARMPADMLLATAQTAPETYAQYARLLRRAGHPRDAEAEQAAEDLLRAHRDALKEEERRRAAAAAEKEPAPATTPAATDAPATDIRATDTQPYKGRCVHHTAPDGSGLEMGRIEKEWLDVLRSVHHYTSFHGIIAGGALRDTYNGRPVKDVDIFVPDQGSPAKNGKLIKKAFKMAGVSVLTRKQDDSGYHTVDISPKPADGPFAARRDGYGLLMESQSWHVRTASGTLYNMVFVSGRAAAHLLMPHVTMAHTLSDIAFGGHSEKCVDNMRAFMSWSDLGLCQIATDGSRVVTTDAYERDVAQKTITRTNNTASSPAHIERVCAKYPDFTLVLPAAPPPLTAAEKQKILTEGRKGTETSNQAAPKEWRDLLSAFYKHTDGHGVIAGDALRDVLNGRAVKTVDVFLPDQGSDKQNAKIVKKAFKAAGFSLTADRPAGAAINDNPFFINTEAALYPQRTNAYLGLHGTAYSVHGTVKSGYNAGKTTDYNIVFLPPEYVPNGAIVYTGAGVVSGYKLMELFTRDLREKFLQRMDINISQIAMNNHLIVTSDAYETGMAAKTIVITTPDVNMARLKNVQDSCAGFDLAPLPARKNTAPDAARRRKILAEGRKGAVSLAARQFPQQWLNVLRAFQKETKGYGLIAGGALRDTFNNRAVKDVDIFVPDRGDYALNAKLVKKAFKAAGLKCEGQPRYVDYRLSTDVACDYTSRFGKSGIAVKSARVRAWEKGRESDKTDYNIIFVPDTGRARGDHGGYKDLLLSSVEHSFLSHLGLNDNADLTHKAQYFAAAMDINICQIATNGDYIVTTDAYETGIAAQTIEAVNPNAGTPEHLQRLIEKYADFAVKENNAQKQSGSVKNIKPPKPELF